MKTSRFDYPLEIGQFNQYNGQKRYKKLRVKFYYSLNRTGLDTFFTFGIYQIVLRGMAVSEKSVSEIGAPFKLCYCPAQLLPNQKL